MGKFPRNPVAEQSNYFLIRSLASLKKNAEALALIDKFLKERPKSRWADDVSELRLKLSKEVSPALMTMITQRPPLPPEAPTTPVAARPLPPGEGALISTPFGQTPAPPAPQAVRPPGSTFASGLKNKILRFDCSWKSCGCCLKTIRIALSKSRPTVCGPIRPTSSFSPA